MTDTQIQTTQGFMPSNLAELKEMAAMMAKSRMVPKDFQNQPMDILVAAQFGAELGLGVLASLQNIAVINGRPSVWGDAALALVQAHPANRGVVETVDMDKGIATCTCKRAGLEDVTRTFTVKEAQTAGLWGRNVWKQYPARMLQMRARGFALRDQWSDVLKGISLAEEQRDAELISIEATVTDPGKGLAGLEAAIGAEPVKEPEPEETQDQGKVEEAPTTRTKPARASKKKPAKATKTKVVEVEAEVMTEEQQDMFPAMDEDEQRLAVVKEIYTEAKSCGAENKGDTWANASEFFGKMISGPTDLSLSELGSFLVQLKQISKGS